MFEMIGAFIGGLMGGFIVAWIVLHRERKRQNEVMENPWRQDQSSGWREP